MRGHFRYLRFKNFPMTPRTLQGEVVWALLSRSEHSGVSKDSKSPTLQVLGFTPTLGQSGVATFVVVILFAFNAPLLFLNYCSFHFLHLSRHCCCFLLLAIVLSILDTSLDVVVTLSLSYLLFFSLLTLLSTLCCSFFFLSYCSFHVQQLFLFSSNYTFSILDTAFPFLFVVATFDTSFDTINVFFAHNTFL